MSMERRDVLKAGLAASLAAARERKSEYDVAATADTLAALRGADAGLLGERDDILRRLRITQLPRPALP